MQNIEFNGEYWFTFREKSHEEVLIDTLTKKTEELTATVTEMNEKVEEIIGGDKVLCDVGYSTVGGNPKREYVPLVNAKAELGMWINTYVTGGGYDEIIDGWQIEKLTDGENLVYEGWGEVYITTRQGIIEKVAIKNTDLNSDSEYNIKVVLSKNPPEEPVQPTLLYEDSNVSVEEAAASIGKTIDITSDVTVSDGTTVKVLLEEMTIDGEPVEDIEGEITLYGLKDWNWQGGELYEDVFSPAYFTFGTKPMNKVATQITLGFTNEQESFKPRTLVIGHIKVEVV